jgi:hypothetical protein
LTTAGNEGGNINKQTTIVFSGGNMTLGPPKVSYSKFVALLFG